jgi:hypothetical protein
MFSMSSTAYISNIGSSNIEGLECQSEANKASINNHGI